MSKNLPFTPGAVHIQDRVYDLVAAAPGKFYVEELPEGSYEGVFVEERPEENISCVVKIGRLALRVVDWWEEDPLEVSEPAPVPSGIADCRGPEALGNTDCGI